MTLLEQLMENKGTVSSALGKKLAKEVLEGNPGILAESAKLIHHNSKAVRSGAAKIIEKVAEEKPQLVAPLLPDLIPSLDYKEPQTRWMMIHTFGLCARLQPDISRGVFSTAIKYLDPSLGTCLRDRAITYLGYIGALSKPDCDKSFHFLIDSFKNHPDRVTRIFESLERLSVWFDPDQKKIVNGHAAIFSASSSLEIRKWAIRTGKKLK